MISHKQAEGLMKKANVNLVARSGDTLMVGVTKKVPITELKIRDCVPRVVGEYMTDVVEVGEIRALPAKKKVAPMRTGKYRPAPGGVSIGHYAISAGTLGMLGKQGGVRVALSNNHVFANSNDAELGDHIWQPGRHDGGTQNDLIAYLYKYVPIDFGNGDSDCWFSGIVAKVLNFIWWLSGRKTRFKTIDTTVTYNLVDCALAVGIEMNGDQFMKEILGIGIPKRFGEAKLGDKVIKSGRTTGITTGEIIATDGYINVQYGAGKVGMFRDQIITGPMLEGGDSGSVLLNEDKETVVGLGFAGSDEVSIFNKIENVRELLGGFECVGGPDLWPDEGW